MSRFWTNLDRLLGSRPVVIDRPKGSRHPRYPDLVYPLDYGYLGDTAGGDGNEIDVWRGYAGTALVGIVCTVDMNKGDAEYKLLVGCTDTDVDTILQFHNNQFMSAIAIRRS